MPFFPNLLHENVKRTPAGGGQPSMVVVHWNLDLSRLALQHNLPMVDINVEVNASSENRNSIQVFPTPESPISNSLNNRSYVFLAIIK